MKENAKPLISDAEKTALVSSLRPALIAFFSRRCGSSVEAEDLAQDVILSALKHAHWDSADEAKGYIFRIAANRWIDRGRRRRAKSFESEWVDSDIDRATEGISLERVVSSQEELRIVINAIEDMPERTREIFVLCKIDKMKQLEAAELLEVSISTIERHLVQAALHLVRRIG